MYDIRQYEFLDAPTVRQLIKALRKLPQNASFLLCGDNYGHIHVARDGSVVNLDNSSLDDEYEGDVETMQRMIPAKVYANAAHIVCTFCEHPEDTCQICPVCDIPKQYLKSKSKLTVARKALYLAALRFLSKLKTSRSVPLRKKTAWIKRLTRSTRLFVRGNPIRVAFRVSYYTDTHNTAIASYKPTRHGYERLDDLTVNTGVLLPRGTACLNVAHYSKAIPEHLEKLKLGERTGQVIHHGSRDYPVFRFNLKRIQKCSIIGMEMY